MADTEPQSLFVRHEEDEAAVRIAVRAEGRAGNRCGIVWLGGFKSDMMGGKATALAEWAQRRQRSFVRFDYSGHGESSGEFSAGTIGRWMKEAEAVLERYGRGPQVLVGSSMGAWIALLLARAEARRAGIRRIAGLMLIAPATDFTEELMWKRLGEADRETLMRDGVLRRPSQYDEEPYAFTRRLIEEGRDHLLLGDRIDISVPVRILQGQADPDVPFEHALRTAQALKGPDVVTVLVKDGDHRLSRPKDLARLTRLMDEFCGEIEGESGVSRAPRPRTVLSTPRGRSEI